MQIIDKCTLSNLIPFFMIDVPTKIRGVLVLIVFLVVLAAILISLFDRIKSLINDILSHTSKYELFIPSIILFIVLFLETLVKYYLKDTSAFSAFLDHFIYELLIIYITYFALFGYRIWEKYRNQNKNEISCWRDYIRALKNASERISALNVRDYNLFSEPLGVRYFLEQVKVLNNLRSAEKSIIAQRIIVICATNRDGILSSKEIQALKDNDKLSDNQRNFYNVYLLHKLLNIDLFLAPKNEIVQLLKVKRNWLYKWWKKKSEYKNLDRLLIDQKCWCPKPITKGEHLDFKEDQDRTCLVNSIITKYAVEMYHIETLKAESIFDKS